MYRLHPNTRSLAIFLLLIVLHMSSAQFGFQVPPLDQAIVFGNDLFLDCLVSNGTIDSRSLLIQWLLNGQSVSTRASFFPNGTLYVPGVQQADMGNYSCVVQDNIETVILQSSPARVFHAYIKMFEVSPEPVLAIEDELVSFDCITGESAPPPVIYWERNGERFTEGQQYNATYGGYSEHSIVSQYSMKLVFHAKPHLDGSFNCVARNPVLMIAVRSLKVLLRTAEVETPPYVMNEQVVERVVSPVSMPTVLDCPIRGKPLPVISWYKDGVPVDVQSTYLLLQNGSLHITTVQQGAMGRYYCVGENTLGRVQSPNITFVPAYLEIDFRVSPQDVFIIAGLPASLNCTPPTSVPESTVTWYKNNKLLIPRSGDFGMQVVQTTSGGWNVVFENIQKQDEGEYVCVAYNEFAVPVSRTSAVARVTVGGAPIFIQPLTGQTIVKGQLATMSCYVQGDPFPQVTWLFEGRVINISDTVSFRQGNQELLLGNINKANEGTYTCRAVNRYGTIVSQAYIKVLVPPVILHAVGDTIATTGDTVIIPCVVYSDPAPQVTWFKDSAQLTIGGRYTQLKDGLYIASVATDDAGTFVCQATNQAGTIESHGTLVIQVLPHLTTVPSSQIVTQGQNTSLHCEANGSPKPSISWLFNGSSLFPQGTFQSLSNEILFLVNMAWRHVGNYTCLARNIEGVTNYTATINIQIPPRVLEITGVPVLYQGEDLQLKCNITGTPSPSVEWLFNRQPVQESWEGRVTLPALNTLLVKYVSLQDAGVYTCRAVNNAGVSQQDIQVYIINRPSPPVLQQVQTKSATSILLSWTIDQQEPQTPVNKLVIYFRKRLQPSTQLSRQEVTSSILQYEVTDLDPASEYIFMVAAVNDAGTSDVSNILSARTFDSGPSEPRNVEVVSLQAHNLTIRWEIPFLTNGQIRKYRVRYSEVNSFESDRLVEVSSNGSASGTLLIVGLYPYTWYSLEVQGATMEQDNILWGNWSNTVSVRTLQAAPTGAPREVKAEAVSMDTIHVMWEAVLQTEQNGPIRRYHVQYWLLSNMSSMLDEVMIASLDLKVNISGLDPWTWYVVQVLAENAAGRGVPSDTVLVRTFPTAPTASPEGVQVVALAHDTLKISWQHPSEEHWNSELSGYIIQYWIDEGNVTTVVSPGLDTSGFIISALYPWTAYYVQVAAYTDQILNGIGPYSSVTTATTLEWKPEKVNTLRVSAVSTSTLSLSWQPPGVTNGIIVLYHVIYQMIGLATEATPPPEPIIMNYAQYIFNDTQLMYNLFGNFYQSNMTLSVLLDLAKMCDFIIANETYWNALNDVETVSQSEQVLQQFNVSQQLVAWMNNNDMDMLALCQEMQATSRALQVAENPPGPELNVTVRGTGITLSRLVPGHMYNISVFGATAAGTGEPASIQATTLNLPPTTHTPPSTRLTTSATTLGPTPSMAGSQSDLNLPIIIGGGVSGLVLILIILLVVVCLFLRRRRSESDEKAQVIKKEPAEEFDTVPSQYYGQLNRHRPATLAPASEDGTDTVDIHDNGVHFHAPKQSNGHAGIARISQKEGFRGVYTIGLQNPSYNGTDVPGRVKNNPTYLDDPSSSDLESIAVSMAFSSEDVLSQPGESTLKRKSKMKNADAAAIARLRNSGLPAGMVEHDKSSLINNEVEVVYNERTAL